MRTRDVCGYLPRYVACFFPDPSYGDPGNRKNDAGWNKKNDLACAATSAALQGSPTAVDCRLRTKRELYGESPAAATRMIRKRRDFRSQLISRYVYEANYRRVCSQAAISGIELHALVRRGPPSHSHERDHGALMTLGLASFGSATEYDIL
jgi:hypothetical protein